MKDFNARLLKIITCFVLVAFISYTSIFNDAVDDRVDSLEESNKVFTDSNVKVYADIKSARVADSNKILKAD